ncbi:Rieske 2Fe-2S domain-containing protein [Streptomyces sp. M2CJ-2]|uniref:aromatic ring-hydroxylating oxygenase subunit alpha n=1 Tax=Streptomyces sp. M2CJ-2 TaxID=2803948 RepID=UPI0019273A8E|nr:SRPBCC family protein [Streptomyces sp. M2CJ-2]MBL3671132.1 Rieske 2Fe-2S domain-containing protein [Streptomyces sp. M2CJ-2]
MTEFDAQREKRIRRLLEHLRNDTTDQFEGTVSFSPTEFTDADLAARERELIFARVPSIVAHSSEIPEPNDFITLQLPRNNAIVVRQPDGGIKAFVNQCRHRGALLEEAASGKCRLFSCGYHRWSYDTDGTLRTITRDNTFGDLDRSQFGLLELPAEERHGFIWVIDSVGAEIDVAAWLGPEMDEVLAGYKLDNLVSFRAEGFDEPCNWKLMQDAFLDGYHIQYAHPNTAGKIVHTNVYAFEDYGRHCRWLAPRKTIDRWIDEDPGDQSLAKHVTESHLLLPNSTLLRLPDNHFELLTFRPDPVDPGRCRMEMRVIVPRLEETSYDEETWNKRWQRNWQILLDVLHAEDFPLLRGSQRALTSQDAGPMVFGRNEVANQVFHRETQRLLAADDAS